MDVSRLKEPVLHDPTSGSIYSRQQEPVLHLDVSRLQRPVLHLDAKYRALKLNFFQRFVKLRALKFQKTKALFNFVLLNFAKPSLH
jgi:hypothetical protein